MATASNQDQLNDVTDELVRSVQDALLAALGTINIGAEQRIGLLAAIDNLATAPIGDLQALLVRLTLANVAGRSVVGGSGSLMAEGFSGLGGGGETLTDFLNPPRKSYFYAGAGSSAVNSTVDAAYWPGIVAYRASSDRRAVLNLTSSGAALRTATADVWDSPRYFYDNKNTVGTVSHNGTENTGAVIESGSGDDGYYTMFADGSMQTISNLLTLTQVTGSALSVNLRFPKPFSGLSPVVFSLTLNVSTASYIGNVTVNSIAGVFSGNASFPANSATVGVWRTHGAPGWVPGDQVRDVIVKATGRWRA